MFPAINPLLVLVPAVALMLGPRLWVNRVLKRHDGDDEGLPATGGEAARQLLDRHGLRGVRVEITDIGDHYDPVARAVRLSRDRHQRKSLTAVTTAAHEVGHAMQHVAAYPPFLWRTQLVQVARVTGEAGAALLLAVPVVAIVTRNPVPPAMVGATALAILGTGVAAQLAALPTELDASFRRALPMLEDGYVRAEQVEDARRILTACSLTYVASSLAAVLHVWPWLPRGPVHLVAAALPRTADSTPAPRSATRPPVAARSMRREPGRARRVDRIKSVIRPVVKPLFRGWWLATREV